MTTNSLAAIRKKDFLSQPPQIQKEILSRGRPQPLLTKFFHHTDPRGHPRSMRPFHPSLYKQAPWLTASERQNRIYCWPCLLLRERTPWTKHGFCSPFHLPQLRRHERTLYHMRNALRLQLLVDELGVPRVNTCDRLNEVLQRRNREVLMRAVDAVNFVVLRKRLSKKQSVDPLTAEECVTAVYILSLHGSRKEDPSVAQDAAFLVRSDPEFLMNVVGAISNVLKFTIKKEVGGSAFASVVLTGHRRMRPVDFLRSTVLRFVKDGRVRERFVGFHQEIDCNRVKFIQTLYRIVNSYELKKKLLAVAVDGLCPLPTVQTLNKDIPAINLYAKFMPCYFHRFWDVVVQMLPCCDATRVSKGSTFFGTMDSMVSFLKEHHGDIKSWLADNFRSYVDVDFLRSEVEVESARSPNVLNWIKTNRRDLITYFDLVNVGDKWKEDDVVRMRGFSHFLTQFDTVFWLMFFIRLFNILSIVHKVLDSSNPEKLLGTHMMSKVISSIIAEKDTGFDRFWNSVVSYMRTVMVTSVAERRLQYCSMFRTVLSGVAKQTSYRLGHLQSLAFFNLLNPSISCTTEHVSCLVASYSNVFLQVTPLKKELQELYVDRPSLQGFSIEQMLQYMTEFESRRKRIPSMITLAELILTMPCIKPSGSRPPVIQNVKALVPCLNLSESPDFSVLYVENELLEEIRLERTFYNKVIDVFSQIVKDKGMMLSDYA